MVVGPGSPQERSDFTVTVVDESTVLIHNDSIIESVEAGQGVVAEDEVANQRPHRAQARRLVLVSQSDPQEAPLGEWDSDTDSIGGSSDVEAEDALEPPPPVQPVIFEAGVRHPPGHSPAWMQWTFLIYLSLGQES